LNIPEIRFCLKETSFFLASLVGAPKVFQAVCRDMIFPNLKYFSVGNGRSDEPHRAYFLTYFIAVSFTAIGKRKYFFLIFVIRFFSRRIKCYCTDYFKFFPYDLCFS
jgi:hypothetical protein